jgi:hypothetical protein
LYLQTWAQSWPPPKHLNPQIQIHEQFFFNVLNFLPFIWNPIVIVSFSLRCTCCNALFWTTVNFLHASGGVYHDCLLVVVSRKLCCWCVMWNMLAVDEGWPRAFQACKRNGNRMRLGEDKKGSSRAKKRSLWFLDCICGIDHVESRTCRSE